MTEYTFEQLIDVEQVRQLLESHHLLSGMAYGLFDNNENDIVSTGWQEICTCFHRVHPVCSERCRESNAFIKAHLGNVDDNFIEYRCGNGMIDVAMPIVIEGRHVATFFIGQFFYEDEQPDREFFHAQAREFGFDPDAYLTALERVPVLSRKFVRANMMFLRNMVNVLAEAGRSNLRRIREMEGRNVLLSIALDNTNDAVFLIDEQNCFVYVNDAACRSLGYSREELLTMTPPDIDPDITREMCMEMRDKLLAGLPVVFESRQRAKDGRIFPVEISISLFEHEGALFSLSVARDISERKRMEDALATREQEFRAMIENAPDPILRFDRELRRIYVNPAAERISGKPASEIVGNRPEDGTYVSLAEAAKSVACIRQVLETGMTAECELEVLAHNGVKHYFLSRYAPEWGKDGNVASVLLISRDITERKQYEEALRETEKRFSQIIDFLPDATFAIDLDGNVIAWNRAIEEMTGVKAEEMLGKGNFEYSMPFYGAMRPILIDLVFRPDDEIQEKYFFVRKDGECLFAESVVPVKGENRILWGKARPLYDSRGNTVGAIESIRDITDHKKAEETLKEKVHFLQTLIDAIPNPVFYKDMHGVYQGCNAAFQAYLGQDKNSIIGSSVYDVTSKKLADHYHEMDMALLRQGGFQTYESSAKYADGTLREVIFNKATYTNADGSLGGLVGIILDITERKLAEMEIREANERFRTLLRAATAYAIIVTDTEGVIKVFNEGAERMLGYRAEEVIDRATPELFHDRGEVAARADEMKIEPGFEVLVAAARNGETETREWTYVCRDGSRLTVSLAVTPMLSESGVLTGFIGIARDITNEKKLEQQLVQSQKMECIGQLAGGVAHDFNNIMTAIVGFAHILGMKLGQDSPLTTYLDKIFSSAERASSLTGDLLTFSRKQVMNLKPTDIGKAVVGSRHLISRLIREDIELTISSPDEPLTVMAGETQLTQILMNLTVNARDAMSDGGKISINISSIIMDRDYVARHGYGKPGKFALITFADTGCGMDEKIRERIFEPFFTTKEVGKGTGLGLATVYGVVRQLGGFINVYSEPGKGTIFRIYLPLVGSAIITEETSPTDAPPPGGTETILLAEDDPDVREIGVSLLNEAGYNVISARDGNEALRIYLERRDFIDLLILDAVMPGKNGIEVFQQAEKTNPGIKAIMMSGYTSEVMVVNGLIERGLKFIQKPVNPREFLMTVREVLD